MDVPTFWRAALLQLAAVALLSIALGLALPHFALWCAGLRDQQLDADLGAGR
jgi:hypothetical protein